MIATSILRDFVALVPRLPLFSWSSTAGALLESVALNSSRSIMSSAAAVVVVVADAVDTLEARELGVGDGGQPFEVDRAFAEDSCFGRAARVGVIMLQ